MRTEFKVPIARTALTLTLSQLGVGTGLYVPLSRSGRAVGVRANKFC
ncbi:hypothetical protein K9N68_35110 (plasmid) [Kovacikia minuta CCNUW1]|nr:hypothetical protein [Kovacikia minuta]UBF30429.1 hypothetical protein K9N68_35110 [Kovacikia minuta CCNUW1]